MSSLEQGSLIAFALSTCFACSAGSQPSTVSVGSDVAGAPAVVTTSSGGVGGRLDLSVTAGGASSDAGSTTCASESREAQSVPVALQVLLDQSGSMTEGADRWTPVTNALRAFVNGPRRSRPTRPGGDEAAARRFGLGARGLPAAGDRGAGGTVRERRLRGRSGRLPRTWGTVVQWVLTLAPVAVNATAIGGRAARPTPESPPGRRRRCAGVRCTPVRFDTPP